MYEVQSIHDLSSIIRSRRSPVDHTWHKACGIVLAVGLIVVCGYAQVTPRSNFIAEAGNIEPVLISSPMPGQEIPASRVTIVGKVPQDVCSIRIGNEQGVIQKDKTFYLSNVGLHLGENNLEIVANHCSSNATTRRDLLLKSTSLEDPLSVKLSRGTASIGDPVSITISSQLALKELRVDFDGDKLFDIISKEATASYRYENPGLYPVWVVIQTTDGLFFSSNFPSLAYEQPVVRVNNGYGAEKRQVEAMVALPDIVDVEVSRKKDIWVLSKFLKRLVRFDESLFPRETISLHQRASIEEFAVFANGDLVIVDRERGEILRIDRKGNSVVGFGRAGTIHIADGRKLRAPSDIFVDQDDFLFVVDSGNKRLLKFTGRGKLVASASFTGEPRRVVVEDLEVYVIDQSGKIHVLPDSLDGPARVLVSGLRFRQFDKRFNNAYWTAVTDDDKICLYLSDGTPLTEPFQLEEARALRDVVLLPGVSEERLLVGTAGRLILLSLGQLGSGVPEAQWTEFLKALHQGSRDQLEGLMTKEARAQLLQGETDVISHTLFSDILIPRERNNDQVIFETRAQGVDRPISVVFTRQMAEASWLLAKIF